jgi:CBS domain-containing protein
MVEVYVRDLQASSIFYRSWGFAVVRQDEAFMELRWDSVPFALKALPDAPPPMAHPVATLRILVPNVDAYWQVAQQRGMPILWPLENRAYGLRDFAIVGPDDVGLCFATRLTDVTDAAAHEGEKYMREMQNEAKAEEQQIAQERAHSAARLEPVTVLQRRLRELLPTLPPAVALGHQATVHEAIDLMREHQVSCVLVVERGQLVGVLTERDVVAKVAATPLEVDRVPLRDIMRPDPDCLRLDDTLSDALHQMHLGDYRHVPVMDEEGRPTALVSVQMIVSALLASFPQELLNLPPTPAHSAEKAPTPEGA